MWNLLRFAGRAGTGPGPSDWLGVPADARITATDDRGRVVLRDCPVDRAGPRTLAGWPDGVYELVAIHARGETRRTLSLGRAPDTVARSMPELAAAPPIEPLDR